MSYQVFARKYRPQTFDDLVGQKHVTRTLKNAVEQNRLAHAYLFVGPRGIGKTSTARILAKALNCVNGPTVTPCGVCDSCKEIAGGNSLDVLEIDGASNNGVDDMRELRDNVRYAPAKGSYKIYIIDEVHMLTSAAFNALLKTLEEPPEHVKFFFATTEPQKVLPTILSRCQRFDLHRIPANLIAQHLQFIAGKEKITLEPAAAHAIARGAEGGLRDAESMLDQLVAFCGEKIAESDVFNVFGFTSEQTVTDFTGKILARRNPRSAGLLARAGGGGQGYDAADVRPHRAPARSARLQGETRCAGRRSRTRVAIVARQTQAALIETDRLLELIEQFAEAEGRMKWAPNKKLHFEVAVIKAIQTLSQVTLTEVIDNLAALRGGTSVTSVPSVPKTVAPAEKAMPDERKVPAPQAEKPVPRAPSTEPASGGSPHQGASRVPAASPAAGGSIEMTAVWPKAVQLAYTRRPLIKTWIESARLCGIEGRNVLLGFAPDQKTIMESLSRPANRSFLEALLKEMTGTDWTVKLSLVEGLPSTSPPEEMRAETEPGKAKPNDSLDSFKNDPLIKEALEIFKGQIKSVTT